MACKSVLPLLALVACAQREPHFALRPPVLQDPDLAPVTLPCDGQPKCAPEVRVSYLVWDSVDSSAFRPATAFLSAKRGGDALDVNALDEVPDSSWFTNRLGVTPEQMFAGYCAAGKLPDESGPDGSWMVDHGKDNGANPGFRVKTGGVKYMLKIDESQGERATAATAIATRLYHAAGYWAPCDAIVYFRRALLKVAPNLTVQANSGAKKPFDEAALDRVLAAAPRRGETFRAAASRWLPGEPIGPFAYEGVKEDDPRDVIPHENRRALRGSRLLAAWLNHFDAREQNTMATWMPDDEKRPGRGHVRHWIIDMGDCFGSRWENDGLSRRHGHSYFLDTRFIAEDFVTLGIPQRPWDRARVHDGLEDFGYYSARDFDPEMWRGEYPMLPFQNMTEADGAWMARILARFTPAHVEAAVRAGNLTSSEQSRYLLQVLLLRQQAILRRYFANVSPLTDVGFVGDEVCAKDLARSTGTYPAHAFRYAATVARADGAPEAASVRLGADGVVCAKVPARVRDARISDGDPARYVVVRLQNGASQGPLSLHLYDLGAGGLRLAGIERPN